MCLLDRVMYGIFTFALGYMLMSLAKAAIVLAHWP